jgi:hypothetical protein
MRISVQVTASKVSAAMTAPAHKIQVFPTTDFKPEIFSSSVVAATHQTQVFSSTDFKLICSPLAHNPNTLLTAIP